MEETLKRYLVDESATVLQALEKMDKNKKGFLIVVTSELIALGTLTDGDVRRHLINGGTIHDMLSGVYIRQFRRLFTTDGITKAIDFFKNESIKFLPIVEPSGVLINIITKDQMHAMMLQDIHGDLLFDFSQLDENIVNHEIFYRPWGFYKTTVMNNYFQSKIISVNPLSKLSLQSHARREEHWVVAHGNGVVQLEDSVISVHCGSSIFVPKGCRHRLSNIDEKEYLILIEVQIGDYFGEDDIVRYDDMYERM